MQESSMNLSILLLLGHTTFILGQTDVSGGLQRRARHPTHRALGQWFQCPQSLSAVKFIVCPDPLCHVINHHPLAHSPVDMENRWPLSSQGRTMQKHKSEAKLVSDFLPSVITPHNTPPTPIPYPHSINPH